MKHIAFAFFLLLSSLGFAQSLQTFHSFKEITITGDTLDLSTFAGKKVLVVNTASQCGFTPQLGPLQKLDSLYEGYGFEVIGFPCNDFSNQEPLVDSSIDQFCQANYNVQFQLMHKIRVIAGDTAKVYKWLQRKALNGVATAHVVWNFNKFLIDRQGRWVRHFTQGTSPLDTAITNWIKRPEVTETAGAISNPAFTLVGNPVKANSQIVCRGVSGAKPVRVQMTDALGRQQSITWNQAGDRLSIQSQSLAAQCYWLKITSAEKTDVLRVLVEK